MSSIRWLFRSLETAMAGQLYVGREYVVHGELACKLPVALPRNPRTNPPAATSASSNASSRKSNERSRSTSLKP